MALLARLPSEFDQRYVPNDVLADWRTLEPLFDELGTRPATTTGDLERTILDLSELLAAVDEEGSVRYIRMTCDTTDHDHEKAHLHFISEIRPRVKEWVQRLRTRFVESPAWAKLDSSRYAVLKRKIENEVALFREENLSLEVEDRKLGQRYQKLAGAMTVEFDGKEQTLQQMARYLEGPDRAVRSQAWEKTAERRLRDQNEMDTIFAELVDLRVKRSGNAGFTSFVDYVFRERERFDYTPGHCAQFHQGVERHIVPLLRECQKRRAQAMGLTRPRPWDLLADPEGRPPLRPFTASTELVAGCMEVFRKVSPELGAQFQRMADLGLLDLDSRKGKAPGGSPPWLGGGSRSSS
ncbi:MAG: M3 family metallopeptidase [Candidatus Bipolaricaulota bacterium]